MDCLTWGPRCRVFHCPLLALCISFAHAEAAVRSPDGSASLSVTCAPSAPPRVASDELNEENVKAYFEENVDPDLVKALAIVELTEYIIEEYFPNPKGLMLGKMTVLLSGTPEGGTYLTNLLEKLEGQSPAPS